MNQWLVDLLGMPGLILTLIFFFLSFIILTFNIPFRWFRKKSPVEIPIEEPPVVPETSRRNRQFLDPLPEIPIQVNFNEEPLQTILKNNQDTDNHDTQEIELQIEKPVTETTGNGKIDHQTLDTRYDPTLDLPRYQFLLWIF